MTSLSSQVRARLAEKFNALLDECDKVADASEHGQMLDDLDQFFFTKGRDFLKETLQETLQERINRTEQTSETKECAEYKKSTHR